MYGFVCIYEGTNICMCEMRMQIRKSVSFLSFLLNSQWQGRVDNCERDWELFSIIIIIMRNVCGAGGMSRETYMQITLCTCNENSRGKPQGHTGRERGGLLPMYAARTNASATRPLYSSFLSLLYHVENTRTKTFLNILVCKKSFFFFIRMFFLFFVFWPWKVDKQT